MNAVLANSPCWRRAASATTILSFYFMCVGGSIVELKGLRNGFDGMFPFMANWTERKQNIFSTGGRIIIIGATIISAKNYTLFNPHQKKSAAGKGWAGE